MLIFDFWLSSAVKLLAKALMIRRFISHPLLSRFDLHLDLEDHLEDHPDDHPSETLRIVSGDSSDS